MATGARIQLSRIPGGWHRWVVYSGLLALAGTVVAFAAEPTARYRATAWLMFERTQPFLAYPQAPESESDYQLHVAGQLTWMTSPVVLDRVLADPEIARMGFLQNSPSPLETLTGCLTCQRVGESDQVTISAEIEGTPAEAAKVCNAVLDAYLKIQSDATASLMQYQIDLLDKELDRRQRELERLMNAVRALHKLATGRDSLGAPEAETDFDLSLRHKLEERLLEAELRHAELVARLEAIETLPGQNLVPVTPAQLDECAGQDLELRALHDRLAEVRAQGEAAARRAEAEGVAPEEQEKARREQAEGLTQIDEIERQIQVRRESLKSHLARRIVAEKFADEILELRVEQAANQSLHERLQVRLATLAAQAEKNANNRIDLEFVRDELARAKEEYRRIADRAELLKTELRAPERVRELRRARPPEVPVRG